MLPAWTPYYGPTVWQRLRRITPLQWMAFLILNGIFFTIVYLTGRNGAVLLAQLSFAAALCIGVITGPPKGYWGGHR